MTTLAAPVVAQVWSCHCRQVTNVPAMIEVALTPADARLHRREVCRSHDAPAWDGDLGILTIEQLQQRLVTLGQCVANLHVTRRPGRAPRVATAAELAARELPRWTAALVATHDAIERRSAR